MKHISFSRQSKGTSVSCNCWRSAKEAEAAAEETWDEEAKLRPLLVKKKKLRPLSKEIYLEHGFPVGADEAEEPQVSNQRLITRPRRKSPLVLGLQLYRCSVF